MANQNYRNLVFEGGGVKGIAYGGALGVLQEKGILDKIQRVGGTSAGAINAALLAVGYSITEVSDIISGTNFSEFADGGLLISRVFRLWNHYGINKGDAFAEFMKNKIKEKTGDPGFTFKQLAGKVAAGEQGFRYFYCIATDLTQQKPVIFSHEEGHNPDTPIWMAVRMSMGIPVYFQSFDFNKSVFVDGGVSYNYAVNIFDRPQYLSQKENGNSAFYHGDGNRVFNYETLGFRLDSQEVIKYSHEDWATPPVPVGNIKEYVSALINFMMEMANKAHLTEEDWNRTVFIDTLDVKTTDFSIGKDKIDQLVKSGESCTKKYFEWREKDPNWNRLPA
jgi:NTE family protein